MQQTATGTTDLHQLAAWANDTANRSLWRDTVLGAQTAKIEARRRSNDAALPSRAASPQEQARLKQAADDAEANADLTRLAEEFAETTRLRLAMTLHGQYPGAGSEDPARVGWAQQIDEATRGLMERLTEGLYRDPGEALRNAKAVLAELLDRRHSLGANFGSNDLQWWAGQLRRALHVTDLVPRYGDTPADAAA